MTFRSSAAAAAAAVSSEATTTHKAAPAADSEEEEEDSGREGRTGEGEVDSAQKCIREKHQVLLVSHKWSDLKLCLLNFFLFRSEQRKKNMFYSCFV